MVLESIEEHRQIKTLLKEIDGLKADSEKFDSKLAVLMENVQHHAEEEEEGKMFPKIRELFSQEELEELGQELNRQRTSTRERRVDFHDQKSDKTKTTVVGYLERP